MQRSLVAQLLAETYIQSHARPLEQALYAFHFKHASSSEVLHSLAAFHNTDGGFGHGLEPDLPLDDSSVICTIRALQVLSEIHASAEEPLVASAIAWLLARYDPQTKIWAIVPPAVNQQPHAPWWHYDEQGQAEKWGGYLVNPRGEVLACLYQYASLVPDTLLADVSTSLLDHLHSTETVGDMHDLACYLVLLDTPAVADNFRINLIETLRPSVDRMIERNPANWGGYCLKPAGYMSVASSPSSPFYPLVQDCIDDYLDFVIATQSVDGAWEPTWTWGDSYPADWQQAKISWSGILTLRTMQMLQAFGRLADE